MPQHFHLHAAGKIQELEIPDPWAEVVPGVVWGRFDEVFTAAFWLVRARYASLLGHYANHSLGKSLAEEVAACVLGGFGMPAEMGLAAFERILRSGAIQNTASPEDIHQLLCAPFEIRGKLTHYRYPAQKARYLAAAFHRLSTETAPVHNDLELRAWLLTFQGIGPKTASWITRNFLGSNRVAILDVHIVRAGVLCGLFRSDISVEKSYFELETKLIELAAAIETPLSLLDAVIWAEMRTYARLEPTPLPSRSKLNGIPNGSKPVTTSKRENQLTFFHSIA